MHQLNKNSFLFLFNLVRVAGTRRFLFLKNVYICEQILKVACILLSGNSN